jgi:hypothetical protein
MMNGNEAIEKVKPRSLRGSCNTSVMLAREGNRGCETGSRYLVSLLISFSDRSLGTDLMCKLVAKVQKSAPVLMIAFIHFSFKNEGRVKRALVPVVIDIEVLF